MGPWLLEHELGQEGGRTGTAEGQSGRAGKGLGASLCCPSISSLATQCPRSGRTGPRAHWTQDHKMSLAWAHLQLCHDGTWDLGRPWGAHLGRQPRLEIGQQLQY